jgi:hypothetical protein
MATTTVSRILLTAAVLAIPSIVHADTVTDLYAMRRQCTAQWTADCSKQLEEKTAQLSPDEKKAIEKRGEDRAAAKGFRELGPNCGFACRLSFASEETAIQPSDARPPDAVLNEIYSNCAWPNIVNKA